MKIEKAYVTKWVGQVLVIRDGEVSDGEYLHWGRVGSRQFVSKKYWTTDIVAAQARARALVQHRIDLLKNQTTSLELLLAAGSVPVEESAANS